MRDRKDLNITDAQRGTALGVRIIPRATRTELVGILDDGTLKIRLMAPPVKGQTDAELIKFLSKTLGIQPSDIEVVAGVEDRKKLISIYNISAMELDERLKAAIG